MLPRNKPRIVFRCDSSSLIGLGHLSRCLILANQLKNFFEICFITQNLEGNQNHLVLHHKHTLIDLGGKTLSDHLKTLKPALTIIDHYDLTLDEETELSKRYDLLVFDDEFKPHVAKFVLNHSFIATQQHYTHLVPPSTTLLVGSEYTLIKDEFFLQKKSKSNKIKKALISLGGSDPLGLSYKVAKTLKAYSSNLEVTIVTTTANPKLPFLKKCYKNLVINEPSMAKLMNPYDLIITSASTSFLETLCLRKPFIAVQCASNQKATYAKIKRMKTALTTYSQAKLRRAMSHLSFEKVWQKRLSKNACFQHGAVTKVIMKNYV